MSIPAIIDHTVPAITVYYFGIKSDISGGFSLDFEASRCRKPAVSKLRVKGFGVVYGKLLDVFGCDPVVLH